MLRITLLFLLLSNAACSTLGPRAKSDLMSIGIDAATEYATKGEISPWKQRSLKNRASRTIKRTAKNAAKDF